MIKPNLYFCNQYQKPKIHNCHIENAITCMKSF